MEPKHPENDRINETASVHEEETVCNQSASHSIFGRGVSHLKKGSCRWRGVGNVHAFVLIRNSGTIEKLEAM